MMEPMLDDFLYAGKIITGRGIARWEGPATDDNRAVIAVRLRWDRGFRKDRSLDYTEGKIG